MRRVFIFIFLSLMNFAFASVQVEADFLQRMSEHQREGIRLSEMALEKTSNPKIKKLAKQMQQAQYKEQKQMLKLKRKSYAEISPSESAGSTQLDLGELEKSAGKEFDKNFLEMMTRHHKSGIEMMGKMLPNIEKRAIHGLAIRMTKRQGQEIGKMERLQTKVK